MLILSIHNALPLDFFYFKYMHLYNTLNSYSLVCVCVCVCVRVYVQSCLTLCDPMDCSSPVSSAHGISEAGTLEWVAISFSRGSSQPRDQTRVSYISRIGRWILYQLRHLGSPLHSYQHKLKLH